MSVRVVHDCEVLLVDVELVQGEGNIGETEPELVVDRNLKQKAAKNVFLFFKKLTCKILTLFHLFGFL